MGKRPGRLVLLPCYMWHGTVSFHDVPPREPITFDVVAASQTENDSKKKGAALGQKRPIAW
jgi:hypothetical protein